MAVDLVNSYEEVARIEHLAGPEDLRRFLITHQLDMKEMPTGADLAAVKVLRSRLRAVFTAPDEEAAADAINRVLAQSGAVSHVIVDGGKSEIQVEPRRPGPAHRLGAMASMGLASALVDKGFGRFGVCGAPDCGDVYMDATRNHSRKHCSDTCTNRESVRSFRRRAGEK
jgi:predicted RNA-binding Zn ribbon-like protein